MTDRFTKFMKFIFAWECVYKKGHWGDMNYVTWENEEGDSGGVTKYGIDQASHPKEDIKNLTEKRATEIYWEEWNAAKIENMKDKLGECYFNCCVNAGVGRAKKILAKVNNADDFLEEQEAFYRRLVDAKPSTKRFLDGWLNRTKALRKFLNL